MSLWMESAELDHNLRFKFVQIKRNFMLTTTVVCNASSIYFLVPYEQIQKQMQMIGIG